MQALLCITKLHLRDKNPEGQVSLERCYSSALSFWVFLFFKLTLLKCGKGLLATHEGITGKNLSGWKRIV